MRRSVIAARDPNRWDRRMTAAWIAVDWGSSNVRAWAIAPDGDTLDEAASNAGASGLAPDGFEPALLELVEPWLGEGTTDVVVCGMAGARGAWVEAGYAAVPCPPGGAEPAAPATADPRLAVSILPGLSQDDPPDVMRGEETQIAGLLDREPEFDGVVCLPGTHSKWVHLSAGEVVSFASYMTGEVFALLAGTSVLRKTVAADGWSEPDFLEGAEDGLARPERVPARLFPLRAAALLQELDPVAARSRLSGLLIGAELAAAKPYWLGREVVLIGAPRLVAAYRDALGIGGLGAHTADATELTLAGLAAAHDRIDAERTRR
jgi:2-dehydro-3-deoxygalactonokinase